MEQTSETVRRIEFPAATTRSEGADEARVTLRQLESEWSLRMEAPVAQLADFELSINRCIDRVRDSLPPSLGPRPAAG